MQFSIQALVLATIALDCAVAQPAHNRHQHKHRRSLEEVVEKRVDYAALDWTSICANGACGSKPSAAPVVAGEKFAPVNTPTNPTSSASGPGPTSTAAPASGGDGSCSDLADVWTTGDNSASVGKTAPQAGQTWSELVSGGSKEKRATYAQDTYVGNVCPSSIYGRNMAPLKSCDNPNKDPYTLKFVNSGGDRNFLLWNKIGSDCKTMNGGQSNAFFKFSLKAQQSAMFAIAPNSQIGFSLDCGRDKGSNGPFCNIGEANIVPLDQTTGKPASSAYDVSYVTVEDYKQQGKTPTEVPMSIVAEGSPGGVPYSVSDATHCNFWQPSSSKPNFPSTQSDPGAKCNVISPPNDPTAEFHLVATFS